MRSFPIIVAALFLVIFSIPAASQAPCQTSANPTSDQAVRPTGPGYEDEEEIPPQFKSRAAEILLGRQAAAEYETLIKLLCDDTVQEYVDRITQTVTRGSNARVPITIKVVDSNEVNAVSFPGGFLYINSGLILAVESEAEIASVVAHEIAHVVARDGIRAQALTQALTEVLPQGDGIAVTPSPDGVKEVERVDTYMMLLRYLGSPRETEADYRGIRYLQKAGYSPRALITFLERMQSEEKTDPNSVLRMFQSHPGAPERIKRIRERIGYPSMTPNPVVDSGLQKIKEILLAKEANKPEAETKH